MSEAYQAIERATRELHRLIEAGQSESTEADAIRDAMDAPWRLLSDAERERIQELAGHLQRIAECAANMEREVQRANHWVRTGEWKS